MPVAKSVAGICVIRDAFDIVPFLCGHYLRMGMARVHFIDDGSSDGTFEFLKALSQITNRISVQRVVEEKNQQPRLFTEGCNALIESGYSIILPFDSDEFWNVRALELEQRFAATPEIVFSGRWINFVQRSNRWAPRTLGLMRVAYSAPALLGSDEEAMIAVNEGSSSFVCLSSIKVGFKASSKVRLTRGQHELLDGPTATADTVYEIFHLPFRYHSELSKRAFNYEPRAMRTNPNESWQGRLHRSKVVAGQSDALWAANSADERGYLNFGLNQVQLTRDNRLRRCLALGAMYLLWLTRGRWRGF